MGGDAMYRAIQRTRAVGVSLNVLLALASWADTDGWCCPSLAKIARRARCGRASVQRALKQLLDDGEIEHHTRGHNLRDPLKDRATPPGGWQATNYYRLTCIRNLSAVFPQVGSPRAHLERRQVGSPRAQQVGSSTDPSHPFYDSEEQVSSARGLSAPTPTDGELVKIIAPIVHRTLREHPTLTGTDLTEEIKTRCAQDVQLKGLYHSTLVHHAIDSALWQRTHLPRKEGTHD